MFERRAVRQAKVKEGASSKYRYRIMPSVMSPEGKLRRVLDNTRCLWAQHGADGYSRMSRLA